MRQPGRSSGWIEIIEASYRVELDEGDWLRNVLAAASTTTGGVSVFGGAGGFNVIHATNENTSTPAPMNRKSIVRSITFPQSRTSARQELNTDVSKLSIILFRFS